MNGKKALEKDIARLSFSMDELRLFLDTHPKDTQAIEAFKALKTRRRERIEQYQEQFGPLDAYSGGGSEDWNWLQQPWPWEV